MNREASMARRSLLHPWSLRTVGSRVDQGRGVCQMEDAATRTFEEKQLQYNNHHTKIRIPISGITKTHLISDAMATEHVSSGYMV